MTDLPDPATLPTERLEHEVTTLAAHIAAATCRWLLLVAELDRREAWGTWGCRSMAHWLSMRCGIALSTAREHVRVGRALTVLPLTSGAFAEGRVSFSQVRSLTRLDHPEHEAELLDLARHATGEHLDRIVRSYRKASDQDEDVREARRSADWFWDDDGCLVLKARLTPEEGALLVAATEAVKHDASADASSTVAQRRADQLVAVVRSAVSDDGPAIPCEISVVVEPDGVGHIEGGPTLDTATVERLACDAAIVPVSVDEDGEVLNLGRRSRRPNRAQRRAMARRDGGRCQFPGCPVTRYTQAHHVDWWARDHGETNLDVLLTLCRYHHRLVHKREVGVARTADGFAFVRADGSPVDDGQRIEGTLAGATRFARVDATTAVPRWGGERLDLDHALTALFSWDERRAGSRWATKRMRLKA
jgi:hypothetical protein